MLEAVCLVSKTPDRESLRKLDAWLRRCGRDVDGRLRELSRPRLSEVVRLRSGLSGSSVSEDAGAGWMGRRARIALM